MFSKIAEFFIKNSKIWFLIIFLILLSWVMSYLMIPKQYNPSIKLPAFSIFIESLWRNSLENKKLITNELENYIMEIPWIDQVMWISWDNYAQLMVKFKVWEDSEKAKINLYQKLIQNFNYQELWIKIPIIKSITSDDLPQITYAISYISDNNIKLNEEEKYIYLKQIANLIKNKIKNIENTTTIDIVSWASKNIIIDLDLDKIEARNTDIALIYQVLKQNNLSIPSGNINLNSGDRYFLEVNWKLNNIEEIKNLIISKNSDSILYLKDIADIRYWVKRLNNYWFYSEKLSDLKDSVFIGFWKSIWTNWVFYTENVQKEMKEIIKILPKNIKITEIQNEWNESLEATNHLIKDLIESILIVIIILIIFLWFKNALNTATSIPLILALVFIYAYFFGYDINRISLFALILVIWMLVDDSIVVVENIVRHLEEKDEKTTNLQAIIKATNEVWSGVILSTITKVLSFSWMFFVTWMMWQYIWPIPIFAIASLLLSIIVAFSINPFISYILTKNSNIKKHEKSNSKYDIRNFYLKILKKYINNNNSTNKKRKKFKITFWISFLLVIILPVYFWVFKARMLPKSNKDQVYVWIDLPRDNNVLKSTKIADELQNFFLNNEKLPKELKIAKNITTTTWTPFMWDFANLFRWWNQRIWEYQISSRINLYSKDENDRIKSEDYVIKIRPLLRDYILSKYPDAKIRVLEDPPWPPVVATFMIKVKSSNNDLSDINNFLKKVYLEVDKIKNEQKLVDLWNSISSNYKKISIVLDKESVLRSGLTVEQIANTLAIANSWISLSILNDNLSLDKTEIILWVKNSQSETINLLEKIKFTNNLWQKIDLSSISKIEYTFVNDELLSDNREVYNYIYAEMWDNSVIYPVIKLYGILTDKKFLWNDYVVLNKNFYSIKFKEVKTWKIYKLEWDWEWKLTMDTFRDLWKAMWIAILTIFFLIVFQFKNFSVAWIIMLPFLLWFFWIFPWFSILYLLNNLYFNATWMIWIISLAWIVVWNAILLIDYIEIRLKNGETLENAILQAWYVRFLPIMLTSISAIFWALKIAWDPVWSWLAWSIVFWLFASAILTLIVIPIFYYDSQKKYWQ